MGVAGGITTSIGTGHSYWAMVAVAAPLTARGIRHQLVRAWHCIIGTLLGLLTSAGLLALGMGPILTVLVVALLQIATELIVDRNYWLEKLFITPMALLMGRVSAAQPADSLLLDRGIETSIGACWQLR